MNDEQHTTGNQRVKEQARRSLPSLAASVPTNLPVTRAKLIGRGSEMETVRAVLLRDDVSLLTLTGLGGMGKTTLALHLAGSLLEIFSGGVFFINLAPLTDPHLILPTIAQTLNIQEELDTSLQELINDFLRSRPALLVFDNFEHLLDGGVYISDLLRANHLLKVMVTSREALRLQGEQVIPIQPLSTEQAVELFAQRAQSLDPAFVLTEGNVRVVSEICQKLDGLPLAIELAAQRTKIFSLQALFARLHSNMGQSSPLLTTLTLGPRDLPLRQQTLRETIAWSYDLLSDTEQRALRIASLFRSACGFNSLLYVANITEDEGLSVVSSLVDKHLIHAAYGESSRFLLLESIREFAMEQVLKRDEFEDLKRTFVERYLLFSTQIDEGLKTSHQMEWFKRIEDDYPNILLAIDWALASQPGGETWKAGLTILDHLHRYWMLRMHFHHGAQHVTRARHSLDEYASDHILDESILKLKADIYSLSGSIAWGSADYQAASSHHETAYHLYQQLHDEEGIALALNNWAANLFKLGDRSGTIEKEQASLALYQKLGDASGEMQQLHNMGVTLQYFDRFDEAFASFEKGLRIAREKNDEYFRAALLHNIANLKEGLGDYEGAISDSKECLRIIEKTGLPYLFAWSQVVLGVANIKVENLQESIRAYFDGIGELKSFTQVELKLEFLNLAAHVLAHQQKNREARQLIDFIERKRMEHGELIKPLDMANFQRLKDRVRSRPGAESSAEGAIKARDITFDSMFEFAAEQLKALDLRVDKVTSTYSLTVREREVLVLLAKGFTNEQISRELVIVVKTAEKHVANILIKLGVKNRTEAAAWAIANGLLDSNDSS